MFLRLLIFHAHFFSQIFCQHCVGITPIGFLLLLFFLTLQLPIFSLPLLSCSSLQVFILRYS